MSSLRKCKVLSILLVFLVSVFYVGSWISQNSYPLAVAFILPDNSIPFKHIHHNFGFGTPQRSCAAHAWDVRLHPEDFRILDAFIFNGEVDLVEMRLFEYGDLMHKIIIVESELSVNGEKKEIIFPKYKERFKHFQDKIDFRVLRADASFDLAAMSKDSHILEARQRVKMHEGLMKYIRKGDMILVGDLDEICWRNTVQLLKHCVNIAILAFVCR